MIPDKLLEEVSPAKSYGLLESIGQGRTDVDQSDGEDEYWESCQLLSPRPVQPDGKWGETKITLDKTLSI